jgi:hypothetical protein
MPLLNAAAFFLVKRPSDETTTRITDDNGSIIVAKEGSDRPSLPAGVGFGRWW